MAQNIDLPADAAAQRSASVDEIIVTATKRAESINKVPMSITAVAGDDLIRSGVTSAADLGKVTPGFVAIDSSYNTPVYFIRGVGFYESSILAKSTVGVYVDEVPLPYPVMTSGSVFDLERVEVLKGPQGTLFGSNATAGAINYIAARPTRDFKAGVNLGYGNFQSATLGGFISGPLGPTLSARLSFNHENRGDWQRSLTRPGDTLGAKSFTQGRLQLLWEPDDRLRAHLTLSGFLDRSDSQAGQYSAPFAQTATTVLDPRLLTYPVGNDNRDADWNAIFPLKRRNEMGQAALRVDYDLSDAISLTSITAYTDYRQDQGVDSDGTSLRVSNALVTGHVKSFNQELRLAGDIGGQGRWLLGGNYERSLAYENVYFTGSDTTSGRAFLRLGLPEVDFISFYGDTKFVSKAVFGNVDYDIGDLITLHAGARYTDTSNTFNGCLRSEGNNAFGRGLSLSFSLNPATTGVGRCATVLGLPTEPRFGTAFRSLPEDNVSWRVGIDLKPAAGQLIYANVSRGYKSGTYTNLSATTDGQYTPAKQEELTAYELGFKSSLLDRRIQLNGALFYYDYADKQLRGRVAVPVFNFLEALINIPKSRVKGAELQAVINPTEGLRLSLGGVYVDSKITRSYMNFTQFGQLIDFKGSRFPYTPKWQLNGDVGYEHSLTARVDGFIGGTVTYRSSSYGDFRPDPRVRLKGYALVDLRLGIASPDKSWQFTLYGRNVTNENYWVTVTRRNDAIVKFTGMPATYGAELSLRF
ncbi:TonB-dependent receptor [Rhizorhabdus dicambivorans]|nr:TonB-dependent receptor [Rhizorhabdus dicambivorans]